MKQASKRICFFGNSHIAALREAYVAEPERWPEINASFVGCHKNLLMETTATGGWLTPVTDAAKYAFQTLGGGNGVDLTRFDGFVVVGCLMAQSVAVNIYRDMRWIGLPSVARHSDLAQAPQLLVSRNAALASTEATLTARLAPRFVAHLRQSTHRPIYVTSQPRISAVIRKQRHPKTYVHRLALQNRDAAELAQLFDQAASNAVTSAGGIFLPQPVDTIERRILTKLAYMRGAKRLTPSGNHVQPPNDIRHANRAYGAAVLDQVMATITA